MGGLYLGDVTDGGPVLSKRYPAFHPHLQKDDAMTTAPRTPLTGSPGAPNVRRAAPTLGRFARTTAVVTLTATSLNVACYGLARAAGATLLLDPGVGPSNHFVTGFDVAWKTFVPVVAGALVVRLAVRRSRRWATGVFVLGGVFAGISIPLPVLGAHDPLTAAMLFALHTVAGAAFVLIGVCTVADATSISSGTSAKSTGVPPAPRK